MYVSLHVKYPLFLSDFNETSFLAIFFKKCASIKFHENPSSGSRVVPSGQKDGHETVTFLSFTNVPHNRRASNKFEIDVVGLAECDDLCSD
jgi:hypothetical protein